MSGILDRITRRGKKWDIQVAVPSSYRIGMEVELVRFHATKPVRNMETLGKFKISSINVLDKVLRFTDPLPEDVRVGDCIIYYDIAPSIESVISPCR